MKDEQVKCGPSHHGGCACYEARIKKRLEAAEKVVNLVGGGIPRKELRDAIEAYESAKRLKTKGRIK